MSLCELIFQKDLYDLVIEDLQQFFTVEQDETSVLEFKSGGVKLEDIYKEVSAFLNTEGGILIIGAPMEIKVASSNGKGRKVCKGELTPSGITDQDTLIRCIASNIAPSPIGIKAKSFDFLMGKVYVLEVPQSMTPPHQCDGRYYIRLERDAKSAPHGIVEALFQKRQKPELVGKILVFKKPYRPDSLFIQCSISNISSISAEQVGYDISIHGVRCLEEVSQEHDFYKYDDEHIRAQGVRSNKILVKGLLFQMDFEVYPTTECFMIELCYYCKDGKLVQKSSIFNIGTFDFVHSYDSKENGDNIVADKMLQIFKKHRHDAIYSHLGTIGSKEKSFYSSATKEQLNSALFRLGVNLPASYIEFLGVTNGFDCAINGQRKSLFGVDRIEELPSTTSDIRYFQIGQSEFGDYVIMYSISGFQFGTTAAKGHFANRFVPVGGTFFDFLTFAFS